MATTFSLDDDVNNDDDANKWSNLLPDLLLLVASKFDNHKDLLTLRSICKSWRTIAMADARFTPFVPLFLTPYDMSDDIRKFHHPHFYSSITIALPESVGKLIIGTAHGFLILLSSSENNDGSVDFSVSLFNPITRSHIHLPILSLREEHRCSMHKFGALLSSYPRSDPSPVLAIWAHDKLFFLSLGDEHWRSSHRTDPYYSCNLVYQDYNAAFAYCHDSFFLNSYDHAKIKVINAKSLELSELDVPLEKHMNYATYHMLVFLGDLFIVVSNYYEAVPDVYKAYAAFKLVKENIGQSQSQWRLSKEDYSNNECVTSGSAFFLSEYLSVAVASPNLIDCSTNCIYNGFEYGWREEYTPDRTAYNVCIANFNLPFTISAEDSWLSRNYKDYIVNDEMLIEFEDSDADEYSDKNDDVSSTKKVRRCKEGTVCTWFIPDPR